jgi:4-carboxymuconolactone decarboxylase
LLISLNNKMANKKKPDKKSNPPYSPLEDGGKGMQTRRSVLGDAHVDKAEANKTDFDADFQKYITNSAWGAVWSRPGLTKRERSLITIALLAALGHEEELAMHIRATKNTGATEEDVKEVLLQTAVYAGVPAANGAFKIAKEIFAKKGK